MPVFADLDARRLPLVYSTDDPRFVSQGRPPYNDNNLVSYYRPDVTLYYIWQKGRVFRNKFRIILTLEFRFFFFGKLQITTSRPLLL